MSDLVQGPHPYPCSEQVHGMTAFRSFPVRQYEVQVPPKGRFA